MGVWSLIGLWWWFRIRCLRFDSVFGVFYVWLNLGSKFMCPSFMVVNFIFIHLFLCTYFWPSKILFVFCGRWAGSITFRLILTQSLLSFFFFLFLEGERAKILLRGLAVFIFSIIYCFIVFFITVEKNSK